MNLQAPQTAPTLAQHTADNTPRTPTQCSMAPPGAFALCRSIQSGPLLTSITPALVPCHGLFCLLPCAQLCRWVLCAGAPCVPPPSRSKGPLQAQGPSNSAPPFAEGGKLLHPMVMRFPKEMNKNQAGKVQIEAHSAAGGRGPPLEHLCLYWGGEPSWRGEGGTAESRVTAAPQVIAARPDSIPRVKQEIHFLYKMQHDNIVKCFGYFLSADSINIVMEYVPRTLGQAIQELHRVCACVRLRVRASECARASEWECVYASE